MPHIRPRKAMPQAKIANGMTQPAQMAQPYTFPAPVAGWVTDAPLVAPPGGSARVLDNWIPDANGIRVRKGTAAFANISNPITSIFGYKSGSSERLYAATDTAIYDITTSDETFTLTPEVSNTKGGDYVTQQFGTAGGEFLYCVNGESRPRLFDGGTWYDVGISTEPYFLSGTGATRNLSFVWSYASRLFFVEKGSMKVHFLPVESISGALSTVNLSSVFTDGGEIIWGATWSLDAGDGMDDKWVVCTSQGEVAVYTGTNPADASQWTREGIYKLPKPLGPKAFLPIAGDILIATEIGLLPLSRVIREDNVTLGETALSRPIESYWQRQAFLRPALWEMAKVNSEGIILVTQPSLASEPVPTVLCLNVHTGAWSRWTGPEMACISTFGSMGVFGTSAGKVCYMQVGGSDQGTAYTATCLGRAEAMGAQGMTKTVTQARPVFSADAPFLVQVGALADYDQALPDGPDSIADYAADVWDLGVWDTAVWDATQAAYDNRARWRTIGVTGFAIAPYLRIACDTTAAPNITLSHIDAQYRVGAPVT